MFDTNGFIDEAARAIGAVSSPAMDETERTVRERKSERKEEGDKEEAWRKKENLQRETERAARRRKEEEDQGLLLRIFPHLSLQAFKQRRPQPRLSLPSRDALSSKAPTRDTSSAKATSDRRGDTASHSELSQIGSPLSLWKCVDRWVARSAFETEYAEEGRESDRQRQRQRQRPRG
jgi:hypothetical protein